MGRIAAHHIERRACIYVRQSSMAQVTQHRESARRQYDLKERAVTLGWPCDQVEVIDEDQGRSGASTDGRGGFGRLVAEVALGEVGAVFGLEVSRLARSCADWYRLLEIVALAKALIVDEDGVYDPTQYNDRLLLGLKGTLSEAELYFLKQRMQGGRRNKAQRGDLRIRLPVGYVWEEGERIRKDPDERVREAVDLLFVYFERIGSATGVACHFEDERLLFPRRHGWGSETAPLQWDVLTKARVLAALRNPVYAGVYAYNRYAAEPLDAEDQTAPGRIIIAGSHPGYISEEQHEKNLARLRMNRNRVHGERQKGSPREGESLLQGIVLCGKCGRYMNVRYRRGSPVYGCRTTATTRLCEDIHGRHVDPLVEAELLNALQGDELELAVQALEKVAERAQEIDRQWSKRIEAARYEAEKAARRYHLVEPENRLVVRTLESDWNNRLQELKELEEEYERRRREPPLTITPQQRREILELANALPRLWHAKTTRNEQRKELLRLLIEDVTLRKNDAPRCVEVSIHWKTGAVTRHRAERVQRQPHKTTSEVQARVEELWKEKTDKEIAAILNEEGYRSGYRKPFNKYSVERIRRGKGLIKAIGRGKRILEDRAAAED